MLPRVEEWLRTHTWSADDWPYEDVVRAKRMSGLTVSLVLPARNEQETIRTIVEGAVRLRTGGVLDEVVVVDSRSEDGTARIARDAGARVVSQEEMLPSLPRRDGKGDTLYMGVATTSGDLVVFNDTDVLDWKPEFVTGLVMALLRDEELRLVKGFYDRPLLGADGARDDEGGGRTTEILMRPTFAHRWPSLGGVIQPLSGEYAARRTWLERLHWPVGYGIEAAMLIDILTLEGLDAIGQVDLGRRTHSHQSTRDLGRMAAEILHAEQIRYTHLYGAVGLRSTEPSPTLVQFTRDELGRPIPDEVQLNVAERPPLVTLREYRSSRDRG